MVTSSMSFKESIKYFFFKYALITILIILILFSFFIVMLTRLNIIINTKQAGNKINSELTEVYENYYNEIERLASSENVINYINKRSDLNLVYDEFYKFINKQKVKGVFNLIDSRDVFLITSSNPGINTHSSILKKIVYELKENPDQIISEINIINYEYEKNTTYTFATTVKDNNSVIGYVIYQLYEEDFTKLLFKENNEIGVITDNKSRIIATNNSSIKGLLNKFKPNYYPNTNKYVDISNNKYYLHKSKVKDYPICVYTLNCTTVPYHIFFIFITFMIIISFFSLVLIRYLATKMSEDNSKSIDKLIYSVNELKRGNLSSYVEINSGDEFELLADEFNNMLDSLNSLMMENIELMDLNYASELKLLQSQFNPHFIFNVLETLKYSIIIAPNDCEKIIISLSRLLRYSINSDGYKVRLEHDLAYIKDYLELNKFRFRDKLSFDISIGSYSEKALIPKLLLQTIVENSIKYGYKNKDHLNVSITANLADNRLILSVIDNGSGMTEKELQEVKKIIYSKNNTSNHIGLYNAYRRLTLLYNDNQNFMIDSTYGVGTTISIDIPFEEDDLC